MASRVAGIGPTWFERRRLGLRNPLGTYDYIHEQIYSSIFPCECWDHSVNNTNLSAHGGVFSLEFSPEGSLLVAACEKRSVLIFDPLTYREIHTIENAHDDCVNCVKFLDSRSFATCSDDFTVALWDARNLSHKVRSFKGHTNWVKNIEYCPQEGLLVTSGFDGNILTWEMNKYREGGMVYNKVFATNGLMRTCLTPDASKMIICTTGGYLIVIHNLDLHTLTQDLDGFKPNMYRLMQLSQTILPIASDFTHLFRGHGKRNRVEFITDFPKGDDAEVVSSLQVHPDGHSAISRNVSNGEQSEWSCIHNIEERLSSDDSDCSDMDDSDSEGYKTINWSGSSTSISTTPSCIIQHAPVQDSSRSRNNDGTNTEHRDLSVSPADVWEALVAIQEARLRRERDRITPEFSFSHIFTRQASDASIQVRPMHPVPDSRIFVTRLIPNSSLTENQEHGSQSTDDVVDSPPVRRRNVSINTVEVNVASNNVASSDSRNRIEPRVRSGIRRKLPPLQRYCSLYRRSLVGQYDRTSVSRKPIYRPRLSKIKFKRFYSSTKLNTNYEMNETRRLQIELNENHCPAVNLDIVVGNDRRQERGSSSGVRRQREVRSVLRRRILPSLRNSHPRTSAALGRASTSQTQTADLPVSTALNSLRYIENNLNSFRETVNTLEGTINSALRVLRRGNLRQTISSLNAPNENYNSNSNSINNSNSNGNSNSNSNSSGNSSGNSNSNGNGNSNSNDNSNSNGNSNSNSNESINPAAAFAASNINVVNSDVNSNSNANNINNYNDNSNNNINFNNINININNENLAREELATLSVDVDNIPNGEIMSVEEGLGEGNSSAAHGLIWHPTDQISEAQRSVSSQNETLNIASSMHPQSSNERTILMGVFRAGSEAGVRGTSMRRHNIAAVTVTSSAQRTPDSLIDGLQLMRNRNTSSSNVGIKKPYTTVPINKKIHQNIKRLTHYIEEPNLGRGFIKELCISPDGRVICSPFGNGIRLLSFSPTVQNLSHCYPHLSPIPLHELSLNMAHSDTVVSTKFSPFHNLLVSGCLSGKIVYYQPLL